MCFFLKTVRMSLGTSSSPLETCLALFVGLAVGMLEGREMASVSTRTGSVIWYVFKQASCWIVQVWFQKLSRLTEVAHDLVPSHIADVLLRNQEAAHRHRNDAAAPLPKSDTSSPKAPWQEASEGQKFESLSISGIGAPPVPGRWNASLNLTMQKSSISKASAVAVPQGPRSTDSFHPGQTCSRRNLGADKGKLEGLAGAEIEPTRSSGNGISGILRRSLDVGTYMLRKPLSYNGGPSSAVGPSSQAALAVDSVQSPARSPVGGAQGNDAVAAFSHDCVTILFAGQFGSLRSSHRTIIISPSHVNPPPPPTSLHFLAYTLNATDIVKFTDLSSKVQPAQVCGLIGPNEAALEMRKTSCRCLLF